MGSEQDCGDDYQEPFIEDFSEKAIFQKGHEALRTASCGITFIWIAFMVVCGLRCMLLATILSSFVWSTAIHAIDVGQRALALAIETEEERHESRENYERLSNELCRRKFEKGKSDE